MTDDHIFGNHAQQFEAAGFVAIPIVRGGKKPAVKNWMKAGQMSREDRAKAYAGYADSNIGLLAGTPLPTGRRFGFIDVDHPGWVGFVQAVLSPFVSGKVGQKGLTVFCQIVDGVRSAKFKRKGAPAPAIEVFAHTGQTVVPESFHPSGRRYSWVGKALLEVDPQDLSILDEVRLAVLSAVIKNEHAWQVVEAGAEAKAHDAMLALAACGVANLTDDLTWLAASLNALLHPEYGGNTRSETLGMLQSAKEKGLGSTRRTSAEYDAGEEGPVPLGFTKDGNFAVRDPVRNIIISAGPNQLMSLQWLVGLAPSTFWRGRYPTEKGFSSQVAGEALIAACRKKGPFNPTTVRGRGVWIEDGRVIVNLGDPIPEGVRNQYLCFQPIPLDATAEFDTARLLKLLKLFRWRDPHHAILLLGWLAIGPICGVLSWRPHCFIYGPPKSGKSTLHTLASRLLFPLAISTTGDSSEAGIRQSVGPDSLPVIIDEFESDQRRGRQQAVVMLARSASSGEAPILRGTPEGKAMQFSLRVSFFFSGINPAGLSPADQSRILLMELRMHENDPEMGRLIASELAALSALGPKWCAYMASKALLINPARDVFEIAMPGLDSRLTTNIATLLAGAFVALHGRVPSPDEAKERVAKFAETTAQHAEEVDRDDAFECLHHLLAFVVEGPPVGQWLAIEYQAADERGARRGTQIVASLDIVLKPRAQEPGFFLLRGSPGLERIFANTKWAEGAWAHAVRKLEGAFSPRDPVYFPNISKKARAIGLPLDLLPEALEAPDEKENY